MTMEILVPAKDVAEAKRIAERRAKENNQKYIGDGIEITLEPEHRYP